jgi:hypothetical protein
MRDKLKILGIFWKILVGPPRTYGLPGWAKGNGDVKQFSGHVYRAKIQTFQGYDGKIYCRLKSIEGVVSSGKSVRRVGGIITDYANNDERKAQGLNKDPWYSAVLNHPIRSQIYDKGHLVASQLGGPTHSFNMAPQRFHVNQPRQEDGRWRTFEEFLSELLYNNDLVRTKGGILVRRDELPMSERSSDHVEIMTQGKGNLQVELPYDDHDMESSFIPRAFNATFSTYGDGRQIMHATNNELNEQGLQAVVAKKKSFKKSDK